MNRIINVFVILVLAVLSSCNDESPKVKQLISDEKTKINVSEEFERDLTNTRKLSEKNENGESAKGGQLISDTKTKLNVSEEFAKDLDNARKILEKNEKRSAASSNENYSILGTWENRISIDGQVTTFVYSLFDNGTYTGSSYGAWSDYHAEGTYSYDGVYIITRDSKGNSGKEKITWINSDYRVSTSMNSKNKAFCKRSESVGNSNDIPFSFYYDKSGNGLTDNTKTGSKPGSKSSFLCTACEGTGEIKAKYALKTDCWSEEERIRPYMTDNDNIKLPCCLCKGKGRISY